MSEKNNNKNINTKPLSGFVELLPAEQLEFDRILSVIKRSFETFGFVQVDTPVLERSEVLLAKAGGETEKQIYRFTKGTNDLSMRFDLTVPLARYVAQNYQDIVFPFRRYSIGKVFRGEKPQAGRFREFYQCDIDIIGENKLGIENDAEIPTIIYKIFKDLGFDNFTIRINNRKVLNGFFAYLGLGNKSEDVMRAMDKLERYGEDAVKEELTELGVKEDTIIKIFDFFGINAQEPEEIIKNLGSMQINNPQFIEGVKELSEVIKIIKMFGIPKENFEIDVSVARGFDYYTGTVYETRLNDYPDIGSVCSGGRYDDLAGQYTKFKLPGVGISIGLTRLFDQLYKKGVIKTGQGTPSKVLIIPLVEGPEKAIELAADLRNKKIPTEVKIFDRDTRKSLDYANKLKIPYVVFIGEDEIEKGVFSVKDLRDGTQKEVTKEELFEMLG